MPCGEEFDVGPEFRASAANFRGWAAGRAGHLMGLLVSPVNKGILTQFSCTG